MYPNGIVVEPTVQSSGGVVHPQVVRRRPNGSKQVIHTMPEGHIPDGFNIDAGGDFWITAVAAGGVDVSIRLVSR